MELAFLLFVFLIAVVAIALFAFPPNQIVTWMSKKTPKEPEAGSQKPE